MEYYHRLDTRRTILDFARAGGPEAVREGAFYYKRGDIIQRYTPENEIVVLDSHAAIDRALYAGASAFYSSFWRYAQPKELLHPLGRDLVWTIRAENGGLKFAKATTAAVFEVMSDAGFYEPWVKYSGELGFDIVIPLESVPGEAWAGDFKALDEIQRGITGYIASILSERPNFRVTRESSKVTIREGSNTCLLSELRARRGLLLAPMSLNPRSGLVSLPIAPSQVGSFSVLDASPADPKQREWRTRPNAARELIQHLHSWKFAEIQNESVRALNF